jgi:hypothetical protein
MEQEEDKYDALLKILRKAKPYLAGKRDIEDNVIERIEKIRKKDDKSISLFDYLFSWVYIEWVRKSLIAVSAFIVIFFVYQQSIILKRINALSNQSVSNENRLETGFPGNLEGKLLFYRLTGRKIKMERNAISEKEIEEFLESVNDLQEKYKDLIILIEKDPQLKKEVEKRMTEKHRKKFKL